MLALAFQWESVMNKISVAAVALAALGTAACQQTAGNNGAAAIEVNGAKIGESVENGLRDAGNMARDASNVIGNELAPAGAAIENGAKAAWNGVKEGVRDLRSNDAPAAGNTAAPGN